MACFLEPETPDRDLLAYLDGEADPEILAHVDKCAHCRARADLLAHMQRRLLVALHRVDCPTSMDLGEFELRTLPPDQAEAVARHLEGCPLCTKELADLRSYMHQVAPSLEPGRLSAAMERVKRLVAELVSGGLEGAKVGPSLAPALAGVRGAQVGGEAIYQADGIQVAIQVRADGEKMGYHALTGLIIGMADPGALGARLGQPGGAEIEADVDELGGFAFSALLPGRYDLTICGPGIEILLPGLDLGSA